MWNWLKSEESKITAWVKGSAAREIHFAEAEYQALKAKMESLAATGVKEYENEITRMKADLAGLLARLKYLAGKL
jgi:hypothetical protein